MTTQPSASPAAPSSGGTGGALATETLVSIVIVSWNTRDILRGCLHSIERTASGLSVEIIVVDNASRDGSADMVRREFPRVILIANTDNRGFAAANNQGLRIARGRYLLLLNPDTVLLPGALVQTIAYADAHPDAAVVGCQVLENDGQTAAGPGEPRIQRTCFAFPSVFNLLVDQIGLTRLFPRSRVFGRPYLGWWDRRSPRDVDVVSGMFMLVRRPAVEQVGLMDEDYFVYAEETDWCYRFWRAGWRCAFIPEPKIIHLDGGRKSTSQVSARMYVQKQKSLLLFHRKNRGWFSWAGAKAIYMVGMFGRAAIWWVIGRVRHTPQPGYLQSAAALRYHLFGREPQA